MEELAENKGVLSVTIGEWRDTEEGLPQEDCSCVIELHHGDVAIGIYCPELELFETPEGHYNHGDVVRWAPLEIKRG